MSHISFTATREPLSVMPGGTLAPGWYAISYRWIGSKKDRRNITGHWFRIQCDQAAIYRVLRFNGALSCDAIDMKGGIVLDYDGWLELSGFPEDIPKILKLEMRKARWYEYVCCMLKHPDPGYRLACWLGVISVALGVLGVALSLRPN